MAFKKDNNTIIIEQIPPHICQMCNNKRELRPYGPGGLWVCFQCGMKNENEAIKQFKNIIKNKPITKQ